MALLHCGLGLRYRLGFRGFSLWLQLYNVKISHCSETDSDSNPNLPVQEWDWNPNLSPAT